MTDKTAFVNIETQRLVLRRFADADLAAFLAYANDPAVSRYQSWESYTEAQAKELIGRQKAAEPGRPGEWFSFAVELKETGGVVGHVSLSVKAEDARQGETGFALARACQGRGLAREAAEQVLAYAFDVLGLHCVVAVTDCENTRSAALLERLGMRREAHFVENIWFKGAWGSEYLYAILRREWASRRRA
ncbi:MAG: GNAT family N-acetyltransferase [Acidobacteria bacterium]|nr:GNAT family N-acetyltransferase [Acidobacteriota bacterium]